jgi:hypothetical protein
MLHCQYFTFLSLQGYRGSASALTKVQGHCPGLLWFDYSPDYNVLPSFLLLLFSACIGTRHIVTFMLFLGMANAYIMRTNMSVAIVAMVNHTALPKDDSVVDDECDSDNSSNSWVAEMSKHSGEVRKS